MVLLPEGKVSCRVDPYLVVPVLGTEAVGDVPIVNGATSGEFRAIPGTVLLVAVVTDSSPVVTKMQEIGLIPVVLVLRKQVTQYAEFVGRIIKEKRDVFRADGLNLTHLWW